MVDTALGWIGVALAIAVTFVAVAVRRFVATGERALAPLSLAAVAFAAVLQLGEANGYVPTSTAEPLTWGLLLIAFGLVVLQFRNS